MIIQELGIKGVFEIQCEPKKDERGYFVRTFDKKIFAEHGIDRKWTQENESFSRQKYTVRGLHFQHPPYAEAKLIRVSGGEAFVVFVDLRKNSKTFGRWGSVILSAEKKNMVFVPRGFCNGLCTLTDACMLLYKMDNYYAPERQDAILWNDPDIGIKWPVEKPSYISKRDAEAKRFKEFIATRGGLGV